MDVAEHYWLGRWRSQERWQAKRWRASGGFWPSLTAVIFATAGVWLLGELHALSAGGSGIHFRVCFTSLQQNCVIDGDTIRYGGVGIRLAGADAPEVFGPKCESEAELGRRATLRLAAWMNKGVFQVVPLGLAEEDMYGRKVRLIVRDGRSAGDALVAEGLARRWDGGRQTWCA